MEQAQADRHFGYTDVNPFVIRTVVGGPSTCQSEFNLEGSMFNTKFASLVFLSAAIAAAQTVTGSITGTATDPTGAVVAGVKVTATNAGTNLAYNATTNEAGVYNLVFLPVGRYTVAAEAKGFKKAVIGPFALEVNQIARLDVKLEVG